MFAENFVQGRCGGDARPEPIKYRRSQSRAVPDMARNSGLGALVFNRLWEAPPQKGALCLQRTSCRGDVAGTHARSR